MAENTDFIHLPDKYEGFNFTIASDINAGEIALVEDIYVLAYQTEDAAEVIEGVSQGYNVDVPKSVGTGLTIAAGDALWLNTGTLVVSKTDGGTDKYVGYALAAATATATHVRAHWFGWLPRG